MIVVTIFLSILNTNRIPFGPENRKENCHHDHIPFNVNGNRNIVFSVFTPIKFNLTCVKGHSSRPLMLMGKSQCSVLHHASLGWLPKFQIGFKNFKSAKLASYKRAQLCAPSNFSNDQGYRGAPQTFSTPLQYCTERFKGLHYAESLSTKLQSGKMLNVVLVTRLKLKF